MNEFITVKEFAAAANVSPQYIYKVKGTILKGYTKKIDKKLCISREALTLILENSTEVEKVAQPNSTIENKGFQPEVEKVAQPNSTTETTSATAEIETLKQLIAELQQDKADLKKDKEYLQQQLAGQQELIQTLNNRLEADTKSIEHMQVLLNQQQQLTMIDKASGQKKRKLLERIFNK